MTACPGCTFSDLSGNHPGPELARGECCDCGFASCFEPHCQSAPVRALAVDGVDVYFCADHLPPACACCGEAVVPREGLWCAECWEAEEPARVHVSRLLMPALTESMRRRRLAYEPRTVRAEYDVCERCHCSDCECSVSTTSVRTLYTLIRSPGGLAMMVVGGVL